MERRRRRAKQVKQRSLSHEDCCCCCACHEPSVISHLTAKSWTEWSLVCDSWWWCETLALVHSSVAVTGFTVALVHSSVTLTKFTVALVHSSVAVTGFTVALDHSSVAVTGFTVALVHSSVTLTGFTVALVHSSVAVTGFTVAMVHSSSVTVRGFTVALVSPKSIHQRPATSQKVKSSCQIVRLYTRDEVTTEANFWSSYHWLVTSAGWYPLREVHDGRQRNTCIHVNDVITCKLLLTTSLSVAAIILTQRYTATCHDSLLA